MRLAIVKYFILFCAWLPNAPAATGQNLVPNPSFEDTVFCPDALAQLYAASNWINFGISPDYYNACAMNGLNVPNAVFGFQYAHSGVGMAGHFIRRRPNSPDGPNAREYIAIQLNSNLVIGVKYFFTCYINFAGYHFVGVPCNKYGMKLSTVTYDSSQYSPLVNNFAHIYTDSIIADSVQWYKISGSIIADSAYNYLILGNFFDDSNTDTLIVNPFPDYSYYYVDDVCLGTDSLYCENWTGDSDMQNHAADNIEIYPNPIIDLVHISSPFQFSRVEIYDNTGKIVKNITHKSSSTYSLNVSDVQSGFYILRIYNLKTVYNKKIIKL